MCTVSDNDDNETLLMEEKPAQILTDAVCKKCQINKAEVVLRIRDTYCRLCFLDSFTHKFRASIGKSKLLKKDDKVLISVSGSLSSVALLQLVKDGIEITSPKRLQCIPYVLYIDEGAAFGHTFEKRQEICQAIGKIVRRYNVFGYVTSLDRSLQIDGNKSKLCNILHENIQLAVDEEGDQKLKSLFAQLSLSSKKDLLLKLRNKLMLSVAEELECSKIFVGDSGTDLAVSILANLSLGRGAQLPYDVGFCDSRHNRIKLLRPMRDFLKKEIAFYSVFKDIESVHYTSFFTKADTFSSIQNLTEKFIMELQTNFPSTVSTVFRTGDKLTSTGTEGEMCILCQAPVDTSKQKFSSLQDSGLSQSISSEKFSNMNTLLNVVVHSESSQSDITCNAKDTCLDNHSCTCVSQTEDHKLHFSHIKEWLCYGCRLIVKEMESLDFLPRDIVNFTRIKATQEHLREQIQDFLL